MGSVAEGEEGLKGLLYGLDEVLWEKVLEWARRAYQAILERMDDLLLGSRGKGLCVEHMRSRWYYTCMGPVRVARRQYRDAVNGGYRYLLDEVVGMEGGSRVTPRLKQVALELACAMPFRRSAEVLEKTMGVRLSHQSIWRLLGQVGDRCVVEAEGEIRQLLETGEVPSEGGKKVAMLMVEADGVVLSLQRERQRRAEAKVGIAYEGWAKVGKDRYTTVGKVIHADVSSSEEYWVGATLKLSQKYDLGDTKVVIGGDGAGWVKEGLGYMGGVFQLSHYHLNKALRLALGPDRGTAAAVREACEGGDWQTVDRVLSQVKAKARGESAKRIGQLHHYLEENRLGLKDYRLELGEEGVHLRRTGAMEGNVDKLVVRRMKNQGMSWRIRGIRRMLCVRFLYLEGALKDRLQRLSRAPLPAISASQVHQVTERVLKEKADNWLEASLPALYGPHAARNWVTVLKSLREVRL